MRQQARYSAPRSSLRDARNARRSVGHFVDGYRKRPATWVIGPSVVTSVCVLVNDHGAYTGRPSKAGGGAGPHQVTFRVTSPWQNPKTSVSGRKNLKSLDGRKRLISGALLEITPFFTNFPMRIRGLPLSPPSLSMILLVTDSRSVPSGMASHRRSSTIEVHEG
jgi:hypothetical protein